MEVLDVLRDLISIRREEFFDADALKALQQRKLREITEAASKTEYYGRLFHEAAVKPSELLQNLEAFPLTEKREVRSNPESFVPSDIPMDSLNSLWTSGSTGTPTRLYQDKEAWCYRHALKYAFEMSLGRSPFELFAHIFFNDFERNSFLSYSGLFPKLFLPVFNDEEKNYAILSRRRPRVLRGYPSVLSVLARLNAQSDNPLSFKSIISGGELLTEETRRNVEESFRCKVFNHYGSMESNTVARECPEEKSLHVSSHSCIVEIVDEKGRPKKSGTGDIAITPLFNKAMPLLRYMVGDRGSWGKGCSCGRSSPVLKTMDGRKDDLIVLPSGRVRPGMSIHPMVSSQAIYSYQVIQEKPDLILFRYVPVKKEISGSLRADIRDKILRGCLGEDVKIEFEAVDSIKRGKTGKIKTITSKVSPP